MIYFIIFLLVAHGAIHLLGFAQAFGILDLEDLPDSQSRLWGALWLVTSVLMLGAAGLLFSHANFWWAPALLAVLLSQALVFAHWQEAKVGTVANALILAAVLFGLSQWAFEDGGSSNLVAAESPAHEVVH